LASAIAPEAAHGNPRVRPVTLATVILAGLTAGLAEVVWIMTVDAGSVVSAPAVAREVFATVSGLRPPLAAAFGVLVHLLLSVLLAVVVAWSVWLPMRHRGGALVALASCMVVLAGVWAFNFLVVLPVWNAEFVHLMPWGITFISKMLFGAALAWTLERRVAA
jgi:hypothetical protein